MKAVRVYASQYASKGTTTTMHIRRANTMLTKLIETMYNHSEHNSHLSSGIKITNELDGYKIRVYIEYIEVV